jgi:hypothetical protein
MDAVTVEHERYVLVLKDRNGERLNAIGHTLVDSIEEF